MEYSPGSLVKARGREWVVLPESEEDLLVLRPLGGTDEEKAGIYLPLEKVEAASFNLPSPTALGDNRSCRLLRDAVRIGFRSSAGPFRSFGRIAVEPRPYQLVPLLIALKLDPIRLLIADDVGIGKTIEASLICRELLDRGEIQRLAVLCPPHLVEQWQSQLYNKFNIEAEAVLPSTARKLEQNCRIDETIFDKYPFVVVSRNYIKTERHRNDFIRTCPECVIVDEAHTCAAGYGLKGSYRHQRYQLIKSLSEKPDQHLILVTATPHSGKEESFRSLLGFLKPEFVSLPDDLSGKANEKARRELAAHFIQRTRADIRHYMKEDTPFPERLELEKDNSYGLSPEYKELFAKVIQFARETVKAPRETEYHKRPCWWSALALLRALASSPAAAASTLRNRAVAQENESVEDADDALRQTIMDVESSETVDMTDVTPSVDYGGSGESSPYQKKLLCMAEEAETLKGDKDAKLVHVVKLVKMLIQEGSHPILFCRFISTADYVAEELKKRLPASVQVQSITGTLPPTERLERVSQLGSFEKRVMVCTDCLSEGIDLQTHFDAVIHYDLAWNPTRHEQRVGRVDRYGQEKDEVKVITYYGRDNQIDGIVLDVLLKKQKNIRTSLGVSIPVPANTNDVMEAIFEGLLLREQAGKSPQQLELFDESYELYREKRDGFHRDWDSITEKEKRSRTVFAQETIKPDEVAQELNLVRQSIGSGVEVKNFVFDAIRACGGTVKEAQKAAVINTLGISEGLKQSMGLDKEDKEICVTFDKEKESAIYLHRTNPLVEGLATHLIDSALDEKTECAAKRCGVIRTSAVKVRTTLLLIRYRFHIITKQKDGEKTILAEDSQILGFTGAPEEAQWLPATDAEALLAVQPDANITPDQARHFIQKVLDGHSLLSPYLEKAAKQRGRELLESHKRVRAAARLSNATYQVEPNLPPDILGLYIYLPKV